MQEFLKINPIILKRFSQVWHAQEQLTLLNDFYTNIETKLKIKIDYKLPIYRKLFSIEEQNNWFVALDKPKIGAFLAHKFLVCLELQTKNWCFFSAQINTKKQSIFICTFRLWQSATNWLCRYEVPTRLLSKLFK